MKTCNFCHSAIGDEYGDIFSHADSPEVYYCSNYCRTSARSISRNIPDFLRDEALFNEVAPTPTASDFQVGGGHYKDMAIQPIDYILKNEMGYLEGNVVKYISRHTSKNGIEDIKKAIHYCQLIIEKEYS